MEAYSNLAEDGPTVAKSISVRQSRIDADTGESLLLFTVVTEERPLGIPVAVQETPQGWLVDWPTFVEFRDDLFGKFVSGPPDRTGVFHLLLSSPDRDQAAATTNEHFLPILVQSVVSEDKRLAFVNRESDALRTIAPNTGENLVFAPVVEVAKRRTSGGKTFLEIVRVVATDWLPHKPAE